MDQRIEYMFRSMKYERLTDSQRRLITSLRKNYNRWGDLTEKQLAALEDIHESSTLSTERNG